MLRAGILNPMFNKKHNAQSKQKMSMVKSETILGLHDSNKNLIKTFINQVVLASELGVSKSTICRYLKSGKLFQDKYYIRKYVPLK